jgi:hypothetical protein
MTEDQATKLARNIIDAVKEDIRHDLDGDLHFHHFNKLVSKLKMMPTATFEE